MKHPALSKNINSRHQGFTLMEVMVSVTIFAIIVTVGLVALLTVNDTYRRAQTERQAIDSLTYVLEGMSRRIRVATNWCANQSNCGPSSFDFIDQDGIGVMYHLSGTQIMMKITNNGVPDTVPDGDYDITPTGVFIAPPPNNPQSPGGLVFSQLGLNAGTQPYLQINVAGYVQNGQQASDFSFQTAVSRRTF